MEASSNSSETQCEPWPQAPRMPPPPLLITPFQSFLTSYYKATHQKVFTDYCITNKICKSWQTETNLHNTTSLNSTLDKNMDKCV